ncbi:hypothetical protein LY76DRAFT_205511 [Colletotrichum caudatum]|nr:hypothetical protein LY76DRAFT_205511 [Colletotrichum caudatum]
MDARWMRRYTACSRGFSCIPQSSTTKHAALKESNSLNSTPQPRHPLLFASFHRRSGIDEMLPGRPHPASRRDPPSRRRSLLGPPRTWLGPGRLRLPEARHGTRAPFGMSGGVIQCSSREYPYPCERRGDGCGRRTVTRDGLWAAGKCCNPGWTRS